GSPRKMVIRPPCFFAATTRLIPWSNSDTAFKSMTRSTGKGDTINMKTSPPPLRAMQSAWTPEGGSAHDQSLPGRVYWHLYVGNALTFSAAETAACPASRARRVGIMIRDRIVYCLVCLAGESEQFAGAKP